MNRLPIFFYVKGEPQGKARPRFTKTGRTYTPKNTADYEERIRFEFNKWALENKVDEPVPKGVPLSMRITAVYGIPQSATKKQRADMAENRMRPTKKPDYDNVCKVVSDALNGLAFYDDAQITTAMVSKVYGEDPMVIISISRDWEEGRND